MEKIGIISNLKSIFTNRNIDSRILSEHLLRDNKRGYIECNNKEIAMVIMAEFGQPLFTDNLPLVNVPLKSVLEAVQSVWEELNE